MTKLNYSYDFHRFDGEGGGGGLGAEASAFAASIGMEMPKQTKTESESGTTKIEYGKAPKDNGESSQVGTDTNKAQSLESEFAALIGKGGKFHDLYGKGISEAIQNRFKNQADYQGQVGQYEQAIAPLMQKYGLKAGDIEGLTNAISNDEDLYKSGAEEAGLDIEQYMANLKLQADAERGRQIQEAYEEEQRRTEMYQQWEQEAQELIGAVPNFDLGRELENPNFSSLLDHGVPVKNAFLAVHADQIMAGMNRETSHQAESNVIQNIQQRASRPAENGLRHAPAVQRKSDPNSLTSADMDEIFRGVSEGKTYSF